MSTESLNLSSPPTASIPIINVRTIALGIVLSGIGITYMSQAFGCRTGPVPRCLRFHLRMA